MAESTLSKHPGCLRLVGPDLLNYQQPGCWPVCFVILISAFVVSGIPAADDSSTGRNQLPAAGVLNPSTARANGSGV